MSRQKIRGITIELQGDATPLKNALSEVDKASGKTSSELSAINRALKFDEGNTTLLAQKFEVLQDAVQQTSTRLDALKSAQGEVERMFAAGEIDASSYRDFIREIETTQGRLDAFRRQSADVEARINVTGDTAYIDRVKSELKQLGDAAKQAGKEIGDGLAAGAAAGTAALGAIALEGAETVGDLGRMNAVLSNLGFDNTNGQFDEMLIKATAVTGEMDSAVEAIVNLANTDMTQGQLETTLSHLTGAAIQFSDTLKLEGMADGLQETLAIGEGAGTFIEYLERSGIELEAFNEGLAVAKAKGEEVEYTLGVMGKTGGQSFMDTYKEMNGALYENQLATAENQVAMARLSEALMPIGTIILDITTTIMDFLAENKELTVILAVVLGAVTALAGAFIIIGPIVASVGAVAAAFGTTMAAILTPIGWVAAAIGLFIGVVVLVKAAWEPLGKFFGTLWDGIGKAFNGTWKTIESGFKNLVKFAKKPINDLIGLVNKAIKGLNKIKLPDFLGGHGINIPTIPQLAKGTNYFRGGMSIVGENGPELVEMPTGAKVHPNNKTSEMLAGGGNQVFEFTIPVQIDGRTVAHATAKYTNRELYNLTQQNKRGGRTR